MAENSDTMSSSWDVLRKRDDQRYAISRGTDSSVHPKSKSTSSSASKVLAKLKRHIPGRSASSQDADKSPERFYSVQKSRSNKGHNRHDDFYAYDRTAVSTKEGGYLNANVVCDLKGRWWTATQGPLERTMFAFMRTLYTCAASQHEALLVPAQEASQPRLSMVTQLIGDNEEKRIFWPKEGETLELKDPSPGSNLVMRLKQTDQHQRGDLGLEITNYRLWATQAGEDEDVDTELGDMTVGHHCFPHWPDNWVPSEKNLGLLYRSHLYLEKKRKAWGGCEDRRHCSAGYGRTGSSLVISSMLAGDEDAPIEKLQLTADNSVADESKATAYDKALKILNPPLEGLPDELRTDPVVATVDFMREWREALVIRKTQLEAVYDIAKRHESAVAAGDVPDIQLTDDEGNLDDEEQEGTDDEEESDGAEQEDTDDA